MEMRKRDRYERNTGRAKKQSKRERVKEREKVKSEEER